MLFNLNKNKKQNISQCFTCPYWDKKNKKCVGGINQCCYLYDEKTQTIFDSRTGLPIKIKE